MLVLILSGKETILTWMKKLKKFLSRDVADQEVIDNPLVDAKKE